MNTALPCGHLPCWLVLQGVGKESIRENSCCSSPRSNLGRLVGQMMCKVTRARCHSDITSFEVLAGSTSKEDSWDCCHQG